MKKCTTFFLQVNFKIFIKIRTMFRKFLETTVDDLCGFLDGRQNPMFEKYVIENMKIMAPDFVHPCPYVMIFAIGEYFVSQILMFFHNSMENLALQTLQPSTIKKIRPF